VRVLIVAAWPPWPLADGISLILHHHLRLLAPRHELTVLASGRPPGAPQPDAETLGLPPEITIEWYGPARSGPRDYARRRWASLRSGEPADVFRVEQQPLLGRMDEIINGPARPDVVHLHGWTTARLAHRTGGVPAVHHSIDAWSEVRGTQAPAGAVRRLLETGQQRKVVRHEARHLEASAAVAVVAEADADALRRNAPGARIVVVPNGVEPGPAPTPPTEEPVLGFHGALSTVANQDAANVLVREVLPRVRTELPDTRALVIGRDPPDDLRSDGAAGIEVTGEVTDVRAHLDRVAVYVAPMATGTGLKNKVLEAMAAGLPVVATSRAMNGIGAGAGVVVADTPEAMAAAVLGLLRDPARRAALGAAGRARVVEEFSWERSAGAIEQLWVDAAVARTDAR
jgi:glycosyltransferase involved in cell wall biosynthesis